MSFAERTYDVKSGGQVKISFAEPIPESGQGGFWYCKVRIEWPDGCVRVADRPGADKLDAFLEAVSYARLDMELFDPWRAGEVTWLLGTDLRLSTRGLDPADLPAGLEL